MKGIWIREERRDENYERFLKEKRKSKVMRAITGINFQKKNQKKEFFFQDSNDDAALPAEVVGGGGVLGDRNSIFLSFSLKPKREASSPFLSHFLFLSLSLVVHLHRLVFPYMHSLPLSFIKSRQ